MRAAALCAAFLAWAVPCGAAPVAATDDLGRRIELPAPARRVVTLAPFLTELAFSAGAGDRVVGVSAHSDHPPQARTLPVVATAAAISLEPLAALRPDLVLAWKDTIHPQDIERLRALGVPVFVAQARRLDDAARLLEAIGALAGRDARAAAQAYRARLAALRAEHAGRRRLDVFLEIWHRPLTTIAGPHWMNEALAVCGARNAFDDAPGVAPAVSWESVYRRQPDAIVGAGSASSEAEFRANWAPRAALAAVRAGRMVFVDADSIQRPTLRLADGVASLCAGLERVR